MAHLEDPYYSGPDNVKIYPYWKKVLCEVFKENSPYNEVILSGSIGTGKSTVAIYGIIRKLYEMSCYENIAGLYGLMKTSSIAFIYFSLSMKQAEATGYGQIKNLLDSIPYFQREFKRNDKLNSEIKLPQNLFIRHGSNNDHAIGVNLIGSILDEANFHQGESTDANTTKEASKVSDLYSSILARGRSRFLYGGRNHSISFLVSSSTHKGSFTEKRIALAREDNFAHTYVASPKLWDVKGDRYSKERFYVFTGNDKVDPMILETLEDINYICSALNTSMPKGTFKEACESLLQLPDDLVVAIPVDFKDDFRNDLLKSIQDIAGVSTSPTGQLFTSRPLYNKCVSPVLEHPFTKEQVILSTGDKIRLEDYLKPGFQFVDAHKPHCIHIDAAITGDSYGLAMSHIDSFVMDDTGQRLPIFVTDLQIKINPPKKPNEIPLSRVRQFITFLRDYMGVNILEVSFDQAHSSESRQLLRDAGFNVKYRSVDRTDEAYLNFCNLLYEGRFIDYRYKPFEEEWFNLIHYRSKRKVDHLPGYAKDISDAKVGSIQGLIDHVDEIYDSNGLESIADSDNATEDIEDLIDIYDLIDYDNL